MRLQILEMRTCLCVVGPVRFDVILVASLLFDLQLSVCLGMLAKLSEEVVYAAASPKKEQECRRYVV